MDYTSGGYGDDHYVSKLQRNVNVLDKAPEDLKEEVRVHIEWARNLIARLDKLDYDQREAAIDNIHRVLDEDYVKMGYDLPKKQSK